MPELPEVETIRRGLHDQLAGAQVERVWAHESDRFSGACDAAGMRIEDLVRRGKYLIAPLVADGGTRYELVVHLGMTGQLGLHDEATEDPYVRARWWLVGGGVLELRDVRRFGRAIVVPAGDYSKLPGLASLGPEPLDAEFDGPKLAQRFARRSLPVKAALLDQKIVAGAGNIYADEALFVAGINPSRPASSLTKEETERLATALREQLLAGLADGGTTLRDYRRADGSSGDHQHHLAVYGRGGQSCPRCGSALVATTIGGRTTTYCPSCQPA